MISHSINNPLQSFTVFAKGTKSLKGTNDGNSVIYTRVSTKEQTEGMSLETQRKACEQQALKSNYRILGFFGGTYESARTDERKEFNRMLSFVRKSKEKITTIIVYSVDRFSRSGANAIYIAEQLRKEGITIFSVTQPTDASTASGSFHQNIHFIFSQYENQQRREKCMAGVKEKLLEGEWVMQPPRGYDIVRREGKKKIVVNEQGRILSKAFIWKSQGLTSEAIRMRLASLGFDISFQKLSEAFRNPFYCGLIVHKALEGKVIEGNHEKLISRELFLQVNGILSKNKQGNRTEGNEEFIPLKRFIRCSNCGSYLRGYRASKNNKYYYKCNTPGCQCNKRADVLHASFGELLNRFNLNLNDDIKKIIKKQLTLIYQSVNKESANEKQQMEKQLQELEARIERLEERFIMEEIDKEMYLKFRGKFAKEQQHIVDEMAKGGKQVSNLDKCIEKAFEYSAKLSTLWDSSDYKGKLQLQFLVFPEGMIYDRKNDQCRTPRVNHIFLYMAELAGISANEKTGNNQSSFDVSRLVARTGVEPVIPP